MLSSAISVLALALVAHAAPASVNSAAPLVTGAGSFSAPAVHNPNYVRNGTAALLKAYAKHHLTPTKNFSPAFKRDLQKRQDGSASAAPWDDVEYLVSTSVGGQNLNLDFDTGSADL